MYSFRGVLVSRQHCGTWVHYQMLKLDTIPMPTQKRPRYPEHEAMLLTWIWESSIMENLQCTTRLTLRRFGHVDVIRSMSSLICRLIKGNGLKSRSQRDFLYIASPFVHSKDGNDFYTPFGFGFNVFLDLSPNQRKWTQIQILEREIFYTLHLPLFTVRIGLFFYPLWRFHADYQIKI